MAYAKVAFYPFTLFNRYIRELLSNVADSHVGCNIGGLYVNVLAYADDIVLLASTTLIS